jgi:hypothetical protein
MTALEQYTQITKDELKMSPIEQLRFFLSLGLDGQDWLDVEPFIEAVVQQLSDSQKQVTLLRDTLHWIAGQPASGAIQRRATEALAATTDLDGLILCHATPDSYRYKHNDTFGVGFFWSHRPTHQGSPALESVPLFTAWEPK